MSKQVGDRPRHRATAFGRGPALRPRAGGRDVAPGGAWCQGATPPRRGGAPRRRQANLTYELLIETTVVWRGRDPVTALDQLVKRHPKARITLRCPQPQGLFVAIETF